MIDRRRQLQIALLGMTALQCLCAGCVCSLQPLYREEVGAADARLEGTWVFDSFTRNRLDEIVTWTIEGTGKHGYEIVAKSNKGTSRHFARLVQLGDQRFLDLYDWERSGAVGTYPILQLDVHVFLRVSIGPSELGIESCDGRAFVREAESFGTEAPHSIMENGTRVVFTGSSEQLAQFFEQRGDQIFGNMQRARRHVERAP